LKVPEALFFLGYVLDLIGWKDAPMEWLGHDLMGWKEALFRFGVRFHWMECSTSWIVGARNHWMEGCTLVVLV
jgi:hypothetical protein